MDPQTREICQEKSVKRADLSGESYSNASWIELLEFWKLVLVDWPTSRIVVRQTRKISISMTAYSTAVGPSSSARKRAIFLTKELIRFSLGLRPQVPHYQA